VDYLLAQVSIARMREPLDSPLLASFVAALDPVNAAADAAHGFVWRLQTDDGRGGGTADPSAGVRAHAARVTLKEHFPPPDAEGFGPIRSPEDWTCPA
jgi:hypothetical protein